MWWRASRVVFTVALLSPLASLGGPTSTGPVATTPHFVFYSDFDTNLNDALIAAGKARTNERPELFHGGEEKACFHALAPSARAGWNLAVDFYEEIISPSEWGDRPQVVIRYELANLEGRDDERARRFAHTVRGLRLAASQAYADCRWKTQDAENRSWIEDLTPKLEKHAAKISPRLEKAYAMAWHGLPIRVDVVQHAPPVGASTWILEPGGHILISTGVTREESLETVFHEASHTLMAPWRPDPVPKALDHAVNEAKVEAIRDLWHVVLFYTTGDVVRGVLEEAGEPGYTPYVYAHDLWQGRWGPYRNPIEDAWPDYMKGEKTLAEAARDLANAIAKGEATR